MKLNHESSGYLSSVQFSHSVVSDSLQPMNHSTPGLPVHHQLPEFTQTHIHWIRDAIQPSHPLLSHSLPLPPIPPNIRVFSNESTLRMRCPKYWSFSFSIIPSKEIPGLISFRMDWLDLLAVQGTLNSILQHHSSNVSILVIGKRITRAKIISEYFRKKLYVNHDFMLLVCQLLITM